MGKNRKPAAPPLAPVAVSPNVRLWACFLVVAVLLAYAPAFHGGFLWDDDAYVSNNLLLTAPDGLRRIWFSLDSPSQYFPLTYTTFRLERALWGLDTFGYHLVNVGLHVANAFLVWWILAALELPGAWLAAGVFALHPVQVESVAWITERKNVLSAFFFLLALRSWVKSLDPASPRPGRSYAAALAFYALALFSKTTACTLPAALVLATWLKGRSIDRRRALQIASFVAVGAAMGLLTVWWEVHRQAAAGFRLAPAQAVLTAARALWFYAGKLIWPVGLSFSYAQWTPEPGDWRQWLWPAATLLLSGALAWTWRRGRPQPAYAALFFAAMLSPLLGFIPLYTFRYTYVADHYQYLACIAPIALFAAACAVRLWPDDPRTPRLHPAVVVLFLVLGAATANRAAAFADPETLWRDTLAKNPKSWMADDNLGGVLLLRGKLSEAEESFKKSIALMPAAYETHYNLGMLDVKEGRRDEALAAFDDALRLEPDHVKSLAASARLLADAGREAEAAERYRRALAADATRPEVHNALGMLLARQGRSEEAAEEYRQALRFNPGYYNAHNNLANVYLRLNRGDEAVAEYDAALRINPNFPEAHFNLAVALERRGDAAAAAAQYQAALSLEPGFTAARRSLERLSAAASGKGR